MNGQAAGFAELGVSDRQYAADEIDIVPVESQRLGRAHPGDSQERPERGVGAGPQPGASAQPLRRTDQVGDLFDTVDTRGCATMPGREQSLGRNFVARVLRAGVTCEGAHDPESPRVPGRLRLAGLGRPLQGELRGDAVGRLLSEEREEAPQHVLGVGKGAPRSGILVEKRREILHAASPGQDGATVRSDSSSTFA